MIHPGSRSLQNVGFQEPFDSQIAASQNARSGHKDCFGRDLNLWLGSTTFFWGWTLHEISERSMKKHQAHFFQPVWWIFMITYNYHEHPWAIFNIWLHHSETINKLAFSVATFWSLLIFPILKHHIPCLTTWIWRCSWEKKGMSLELNRNATYRINPKRDRTQQDIDKSRGSWWDLIDKIHQIHSESGTLLSASFWNCYSFTLQRPHDLSGSIQI